MKDELEGIVQDELNTWIRRQGKKKEGEEKDEQIEKLI